MMKPLCTLALLVCATLAHGQGQAPCQPLAPREGGGIVIAKAGRWCATRDLLVDSHYRPFSHGSNYKNDDRIQILIAASDVVLDLQQHTVTANAALRAAIETPGDDAENYPDAPAPVVPSRLTIRNGSIRVTNRANYGVGIKILSAPDALIELASDSTGLAPGDDGGASAATREELGQFLAANTRAQLPRTAQGYAARQVLIENVRIRSARWGIAVQGAGTVIRNSVIEVDGGTAIRIYGPGALIENNTIIVHGKNSLVAADAAIRLHHGDGAIIRNNTIVLKGNAHPWAVTSIMTWPFTMQGNTVNGKPAARDTVKVF